jgi:hypothetical protein
MRLRIVLALFQIGILCGALAGFGVVQIYVHRAPIWIVTVIPWAFLLVFYGYKITIIKRKINGIEEKFKDNYGYDINDREPFDKYLDDLVENSDNRN